VSWQRVRGHDGLIISFGEMLKRGRLGHAYLFVGPSGVGKKLFATEFAKALVCERAGGKFDACDQCPACSQVDAGTHPDVIFAARPEDKNEFPIDDIRSVTEKLYLKASRGGYKVAVIDDADDFNDASANCFLKTLEEPPPKSILILLATDSERQLSTIVSRCQVVRFAPLAPNLVSDLLVEQGIDREKADRLAGMSAGSLGLARDLAEDDLWKFRSELNLQLAAPRIDAVGLGRKWMAFVEEAGKESGQQRRRAALILKLIVDLLGRALRVSAGAVDTLGGEDQPAVKALGERLGTERLLKLIDRTLEADMQIDRKVQLVLIVEALADAFAG
jgi:DNA polymerase III subunit delta'